MWFAVFFHLLSPTIKDIIPFREGEITIEKENEKEQEEEQEEEQEKEQEKNKKI